MNNSTLCCIVLDAHGDKISDDRIADKQAAIECVIEAAHTHGWDADVWFFDHEGSEVCAGPAPALLRSPELLDRAIREARDN